jgi:anti-anti-sigma regulatory factor
VVQQLPAGVTVIRATGDVNRDTSSQLYSLLANELLREPAQLVLELSNLVSVDNAVVDALVSASAVAGESDISFSLVASHTSPVVATLAEAGLIERFEVFPTVRAATGDRQRFDERSVSEGDSPNSSRYC